MTAHAVRYDPTRVPFRLLANVNVDILFYIYRLNNEKDNKILIDLTKTNRHNKIFTYRTHRFSSLIIFSRSFLLLNAPPLAITSTHS